MKDVTDNFFYNHVLSGYGYAKGHLEQAKNKGLGSISRAFHSVIGNLERIWVLGSIVGLLEGTARGVGSLVGRVAKSFSNETSGKADHVRGSSIPGAKKEAPRSSQSKDCQEYRSSVHEQQVPVARDLDNADRASFESEQEEGGEQEVRGVISPRASQGERTYSQYPLDEDEDSEKTSWMRGSETPKAPRNSRVEGSEDDGRIKLDLQGTNSDFDLLSQNSQNRLIRPQTESADFLVTLNPLASPLIDLHEHEPPISTQEMGNLTRIGEKTGQRVARGCFSVGRRIAGLYPFPHPKANNTQNGGIIAGYLYGPSYLGQQIRLGVAQEASDSEESEQTSSLRDSSSTGSRPSYIENPLTQQDLTPYFDENSQELISFFQPAHPQSFNESHHSGGIPPSASILSVTKLLFGKPLLGTDVEDDSSQSALEEREREGPVKGKKSSFVSQVFDLAKKPLESSGGGWERMDGDTQEEADHKTFKPKQARKERENSVDNPLSQHAQVEGDGNFIEGQEESHMLPPPLVRADLPLDRRVSEKRTKNGTFRLRFRKNSVLSAESQDSQETRQMKGSFISRYARGRKKADVSKYERLSDDGKSSDTIEADPSATSNPLNSGRGQPKKEKTSRSVRWIDQQEK